MNPSSNLVRTRLATSLACLIVCVAAACPARAVQSISAPKGQLVFQFPPSTTARTTYISVPLRRDVLFSGSVNQVSASSFTTTSGPWSPANLTLQPFYVFFTTGAQAGRALLITQSDTSTGTIGVQTNDYSSQVTPLNAPGFSVATGDFFEVRPGDTLSSLFGRAGTPLVFGASTNSATADTVGIWNSVLFRWDTYFFSAATNSWVLVGAGSANQNNTAVPPNTALAITRRSPQGTGTVALTGAVPLSRALIKDAGRGVTIYSGLIYPANISLGALDFGPNWVSNDNPAVADQLIVYRAGSPPTPTTYFKRASDGQWQQIGAPGANVSGVVIPAGAGVGLLRRGSYAGAASFLTLAVPYGGP